MNILPLIRGRYDALSPAEKSIANVILNAPQAVAEMTIAHLAAEASVSQGSVINFCTGLGVKGFTDLKLNLARYAPSFEGFHFSGVTSGDSALEALLKIQKALVSGLEETSAFQSEGALQQAALAIRQAAYIEIYGAGDAMSAATHFQSSLLRIGIRASVVADPMIAALSAEQLPPNSLAIGISHSGRTHSTLRTLEVAKRRGATVLTVCSFPDSPIPKLADIPLFIRCEEVDNQREAQLSCLLHMFLLDSLCFYLAAQEGDKTLRIMDEMSTLFEEYR